MHSCERLLDTPDEFTDSRRDYALQDRFAILLGEFLETTFEQIDRTAHYLPAARSGILQGHKLLASMFHGVGIQSRCGNIGVHGFARSRIRLRKRVVNHRAR